MKTISGIIPVLPIPFFEDESIDEPSLRKTADWVASQGLGGMCLPAYGSEFYKLSEAEREQVISIAIEANKGRIPVIAQANHGSSKIAAEFAKTYEGMGADAISCAIPRQFAATDDDLMEHCGRIADAVSLPIVIQDFNPGGPTVSVDFIDRLNKEHPNVRYVKVEEPFSPSKMKAIKERVGDRMEVFEGWGGYYMLEAVAAGATGILPGVPIADLENRVFQNCVAGKTTEAYDLYAAILPFIAFELQDFELFLQVEKQLMVKRGLFTSAKLRSQTFTPNEGLQSYTDFLINQIFRILARENLPATCG